MKSPYDGIAVGSSSRTQVTIDIKLPEKLAERVCALIGGVTGVRERDPQLWFLFEALNRHLPNRTECFSDFFKGPNPEMAWIPPNWGTD